MAKYDSPLSSGLYSSFEHDSLTRSRSNLILQFGPGRTGFRKNYTGSDLHIQTTLITVVRSQMFI